jgi:hypothetical protein
MNAINLTDLAKPFKDFEGNISAYYGHIKVAPDFNSYDIKTKQLFITYIDSSDHLEKRQFIELDKLSPKLPELVLYLFEWNFDTRFAHEEDLIIKFGQEGHEESEFLCSSEDIEKWCNSQPSCIEDSETGAPMNFDEVISRLDSEDFWVTELFEFCYTIFDKSKWSKLIVRI